MQLPDSSLRSPVRKENHPGTVFPVLKLTSVGLRGCVQVWSYGYANWELPVWEELAAFNNFPLAVNKAFLMVFSTVGYCNCQSAAMTGPSLTGNM